MSPLFTVRGLRLISASVTLAIAVLVIMMTTLHAAEITVNTTDDELNADGDCALREAIEAANTDGVVDNCAAGNGRDNVILSTGTWRISQPLTTADTNATGDFDIVNDLTLAGAGANRTVLDGSQIDRLIHVHISATVEISGVTLANGHAPNGIDHYAPGTPVGNGENGGAILNEGALTVRRCTLRDNSAGNGGYIGMAFPDVAGSMPGAGGGIYNTGLLTITQSAVISNHAGLGGAISMLHGRVGANGGKGGGLYNAGLLYLQNSTVSHNYTPDGEDVYNLLGRYLRPGSGGDGGGLYNASAATLNNVTLVANRAGHGGIGTISTSIDGVMTDVVTAIGIDGSGGGVLAVAENSALGLRNTILGGNMAVDSLDCAGTVVSLGYNLIQDTNSCQITGTSEGNQIGVGPALFPLDLYGGSTPVHPPFLPGLAMDGGSCTDSWGAPVEVDQQGTSRPLETTCDIGACEAALPAGLLYLPVIQR